MDFWVKAAQLILSLSILVILHELGHYIPAKLFKTRVEKFYLFFDPWFSIFKKKIGDTEWGIGWLPLGGYVKISGMVDESMDKEQLAQPAQPWEFRSKPAWQRLIIMLGGVTVNLLLGIFIYIMIVFAYGEEKLNPNDLKAGVSIHPYLNKYGLESGDNILKINGEKLDNVADATLKIWLFDGKNLEVKKQDGTIKTVKLPEGFEYKIFEEGAIPVVSPRVYNGKIESLTSVSDFEFGKDKIKKNDILLKINGKSTDKIQDYTVLLNSSKTNSILVLREKDSLEIKVSKTDINKLLGVFPTMKIGLLPNDKISSFNGQKIKYFDEVTDLLYQNKGKSVDFEVLRAGKLIALSGVVPKSGKLGFSTKNMKVVDKFKHINYSFGESFGVGLGKGMKTLRMYTSQLKFLFTKKGASSIGGFGSIGKMFPSTWNWQTFWELTAFISIVLAFMNILPIPALDGGHVVFLLYEIVTGKEAPQKVLEYAQYAGFILLLGLLLYANGNDIYGYFFK